MDIQEAIEHLNDVLNDDDRWTDCAECKEEHEQLREFLEELQQYRQIGTVDECRAAREKQIPKEPIDDKYRHKCCPICGWLVCYDEGWGDKYVPHCENCGQALKWGD